jgi:hypothetical protein
MMSVKTSEKGKSRSAKPLYSGSNPLAASRKFKGLAYKGLTPFYLDDSWSVCSINREGQIPRLCPSISRFQTPEI